MKKKLGLLVLIMVIIVVFCIFISNQLSPSGKEKEKKIKVVATFYPMYIATKNIVSGVDEIELSSLTKNQTGCLHDYQMTTKDMKSLEDADVLIVNGGGMESFIEDIIKAYPDITIINASEGIPLIEEEHEETNAGEKDAKEEEETNAHMWLNIDNYKEQINNIKQGLIQFDKKNSNDYIKNADSYEKKLTDLKSEVELNLSNPVNKKIIIFHDAFAYLAKELGLEVEYAVEMDSDTASLSAGEIATLIDNIKKNNVKVLFTEKQYSDSIAKSIAQETKAKVYVIDSLVTGDSSEDAYINGMKENIKVLKKALFE